MATHDTGDRPVADVTEGEAAALHEVELGLEWLQRAHGHLIEFHHATGHGMDHLAAAEGHLRECGYDELADALRDDLLPLGVVRRGEDGSERWSYDVLEDFQEGFLADVDAFERRSRARVADGARHVAERRQERAWAERARREDED